MFKWVFWIKSAVWTIKRNAQTLPWLVGMVGLDRWMDGLNAAKCIAKREKWELERWNTNTISMWIKHSLKGLQKCTEVWRDCRTARMDCNLIYQAYRHLLSFSLSASHSTLIATRPVTVSIERSLWERQSIQIRINASTSRTLWKCNRSAWKI